MMKLFCDRCKGEVKGNPDCVTINHKETPLVIQVRVTNGHCCEACLTTLVKKRMEKGA